MFSVLWMNTSVQMKTGNNLDAVNSCRVAIERIGKDAREGRSLGDVFGAEDAGGLVVGTSYFPSLQDPVYGAGQAPAGGNWPGWATHGTPNPGRYQLSNTCLIVQVPVYDSSGWPTMIKATCAPCVLAAPHVHTAGEGNPVPTKAMGNQANVETHIYNVIADPDNAGEFILQVFVAPGRDATGYVAASRTRSAQTLVKGIIGPKIGNDLAIFQYLARRGSTDDTTPSGQPQNTVDVATTTLANFTGVIINLEVRKRDYSVNKPVTLAFKQEVFIRNNAMSTSVGNPP